MFGYAKRGGILAIHVSATARQTAFPPGALRLTHDHNLKVFGAAKSIVRKTTKDRTAHQHALWRADWLLPSV